MGKSGELDQWVLLGMTFTHKTCGVVGLDMVNCNKKAE